mgnify:CR=1 FL=1
MTDGAEPSTGMLLAKIRSSDRLLGASGRRGVEPMRVGGPDDAGPFALDGRPEWFMVEADQDATAWDQAHAQVAAKLGIADDDVLFVEPDRVHDLNRIADGDDGDTVLFVGPNLLKMERDHAFRPDDFRFWVALHECTHRLQFTGVLWLREYFLGLVDELVATSKPEAGHIARVAAELREAAAAGEPLIDEAGIFGVFATPEQREVIDRVQALMALLEGHGHVVMDRIGERELVTQARMSAVLKARRSDKRTAALMRLIGLELKLRQYEMGAQFIKGVEARASWSTLDHAWESPEALPTLEEIGDPEQWLQRIA